MSGFAWLHLTDLHVRFHGTLWQRSRFREELERDLAQLHEKTGSIDVILATGDLALLGLEGEFEMVTEGLASLTDFLDKLGSRPTLLAVPGNHDLVRTSPAAAADPASWEKDPRARDAFFDEPDHPLRTTVVNAFTPFSKWLAAFRKRYPGSADVTVTPGLLPGDFVATLRKNNRQFAIAGLNTAFLELAGHNAFGALDLDPRQLTTNAGPLGDFVRTHDAALLLTHHPPAALSPAARKRLSTTIAPPGRFALHLAGSLRGSPPPFDAYHAKLFVGHPFSGAIEGDAKRGFAAGRLDIDESGQIATVSIWPRILSFARREPYFGPDTSWPLGPSESITRTLAVASSAGSDDPSLLQPSAAETPKSHYLSLLGTLATETIPPPGMRAFAAEAEMEDDDADSAPSKEEALERKKADEFDDPPTAPVPTGMLGPRSLQKSAARAAPIRVDVHDAKPAPPADKPSAPPAAPAPQQYIPAAAGAPSIARTLPSGGMTPPPPPQPSEPVTLRFAPGMSFAGVIPTGVIPAARAAFSPSGETLAFLYADGFLSTWNVPGKTRGWSTSLEHRACFDLCFSPNGQYLAVRSADRLFILDAAHGLLLRQTALDGADGTGLAWSPNGFLATGQPDGKILFFAEDDLAPVGHLDHGFCPRGVFAVEVSPDGDWLVSGGDGGGFVAISTIPAGALPDRGFTRAGQFHRAAVLGFAFRPGSVHVASASYDGTIAIWSLENGALISRLEGHTAAVLHIAFSFDGRLLVSHSRDGSILVWSTETWEVILRFQHVHAQSPNPLFSPKEDLLALPGPNGLGFELIALDVERLLDRPPTEKTLHTATAKVVLLGEGRAGKSCLALRLAEDRYLEQPSTHGMRFWTISGDRLGLPANGGKGHHRELVIWDLGGQDEYRLVHPLFLADTQLAVLVFEPGRGSAAELEIAGWNDHLLGDDERAEPRRRILVGTKVDDEHAPEDREAIERLRVRTGALAYVSTSARIGRGVGHLRQTIVGSIDWSAVGPTSRPVVFEHIRAYIDRARKSGRVVLPLAEIESDLRMADDGAVDDAAIFAVASHLARQGLVALIRLSDGTRALVLHVEQIARYAGSLVLLARQSPHGVPALDIASLLGPTARFPRISAGERLRKDQELGVLDGVISLLIEQGISFLHEGLLVFPALFPSGKATDGQSERALAPAIRYEMSRPAATVYASAVAAIALSRRFGPARLGAGRADFGRPGEGLSRISIESEPTGKARGALAVAFSLDTPDDVRRLFAAFLEDHLRQRGVQFFEKMAIRCACGHEFSPEVVERRLVAGHSDVGCPECDARTPLVPRQTAEGSLDAPIFALRRESERRRDASVDEARMTMSTARISEKASQSPLRILHLSDLHVSASSDPEVLLRPLLTDLRDRHEGLSLEKLDFLVVSGDITNRASADELDRARELISLLAREMALSAERCLLVPGNHDLDWECSVYDFKNKRHVDEKKLAPGSFVRQPNGYLVRDDARYPERFRNFSRHFYHPLLLAEYPLEPEAQGISTLFAAERIQFFLFNSSWEIDEFHSDRAGLCPGAVSRALDAGERQVRDARARGDLPAEANVLRLAVFHHPVTGNDKMIDAAFLEQFRRSDIRAVFHGHVHEERVAIEGNVSPFRHLHVVGAGSFGAPGSHRPESVPRLYNLITISRSLDEMRVDTRCLRKPTGAWEAFAVWPGQRPGEKRSYYEVPLK